MLSNATYLAKFNRNLFLCMFIAHIYLRNVKSAYINAHTGKDLNFSISTPSSTSTTFSTPVSMKIRRNESYILVLNLRKRTQSS
jgi:hypothetical protein